MKANNHLKFAGVAEVDLTGLGVVPQSVGAAKSPSVPKNPFSGKTINLISSGGAGSTHDLHVRAVAPGIGQYLHATVDVVDMPGGGQLFVWIYINRASPNGLTFGNTDVEGTLANLWEKVPNNSVDPAKYTWLGSYPGARSRNVLFISNSAPQP